MLVGVLLGNAYNTYEHFDFSHSTDSKNYVRMADGDYNVLVTHRYRIIVPCIAGTLNNTFIQPIFQKIWPDKPSIKGIQLAFFIVNLALMGLLGLLLFYILEIYTSSIIALLTSMMVLMSRWANYSAALPLVDSLYLCCIAALIWGMVSQKNSLIYIALLLGFADKESFVLYWPLIFLLDKRAYLGKVLSIVLSIIFVWGIHYWVDTQTTIIQAGSVENALNHWDNISISLYRLFSIGGIGELWTVLGIFSLPIIWMILKFKQSKELFKQIPFWVYYLILAAGAQALISTSIARMLYTAAPAWGLCIALFISEHPDLTAFRSKFIFGSGNKD
jgi:hypothetical protein